MVVVHATSKIYCLITCASSNNLPWLVAHWFDFSHPDSRREIGGFSISVRSISRMCERLMDCSFMCKDTTKALLSQVSKAKCNLVYFLNCCFLLNYTVFQIKFKSRLLELSVRELNSPILCTPKCKDWNHSGPCIPDNFIPFVTVPDTGKLRHQTVVWFVYY